MKKLEQRIKFSYYRYAPETLNVKLDGKPFMFSSIERGHITNHWGNKKKMLAETKRIIRNRLKETGYIFPVFFKENSNQFVYSRNLYGRYGSDISERLRLYKEWKHFLEKNNFEYSVTTGDFDPFAKKQERKTEKVYFAVDFHRFVWMKGV